jgi:hemerythrin-like domain-containing protein
MALQCVETLIAAHRSVEGVLTELENLIDDFLANAEVPDTAKQALGSISDFLAKDLVLHIRKEHYGLFPALERFLPLEQGPITVMLHEHAEIARAVAASAPERTRLSRTAPPVGWRQGGSATTDAA